MGNRSSSVDAVQETTRLKSNEENVYGTGKLCKKMSVT